MARVIDLVGGTVRAAQHLGLNRGTLLKWRRGEARIPLDDAALLANEAGVALDWIASGIEVRAAAQHSISRFAPDASGNPVRQPADADTLGVHGDFFTLHRLDPKRTGIVRVMGDAMSPEMPEGSLAIIDMRLTMFNDEGVWALGRPGAVMFRRVAFEGDSIRLSAASSSYRDIVAKGSDALDFKVWGRVAMALTRK